VIGSLAIGIVCLVLFIFAEQRTKSPMMPLHLFGSRTFSLANALTLLLYGALGAAFFLVPLLLIQVQGYSATAAGAALLPMPIIMFALSRWSGGLVARVGATLPLTIGPTIAALGFGLFARAGIGSSYWGTIFPAAVLLGLGMAVTVAPLTTTVMAAVPSDHAGVASGINNTVARVAGLLAIAVFGVILVRRFDMEINPRLERMELSPAARQEITRELPKMAGAQLDSVNLTEHQRAVVKRSVAEAFVAGFRLVVMGAGVLALASAAFGAGIREKIEPRSS
jgi:predicted MFS family arabinose efflux permease